MQTFENFLEDKFSELEIGILDDDLPDAFSAWLENLDGEEYMEFGQQYGEKCWIEAKEEILDAFGDSISKLGYDLNKVNEIKEIPGFEGTLEKLDNLTICKN